MTSEQQPRILVVGSGAIGSFYGALLARTGAEVSIVVRSDYEQVHNTGVRIDSPLGDLSFRPAHVLRAVEEYRGEPDYLILSVKVLDDLDRGALIRPAVGPKTAIVLIENGIEIEPPIRAAFPDNTLISALAFVGVSRIAPGHMQHKAYGRLVIGEYPQGMGATTRRFAELIKAGGVNCAVSDDIVTERWRKCVWNAAFNPVSVVTGAADTQTMLRAPEGEALIRRLMTEICAVAAATSYPMPDNLIDESLKNTYAMPAYHTSMALDYLNNRSMEVEAILGNVVRAGRERGVPIPSLETVYALMKIVQRRVAVEKGL